MSDFDHALSGYKITESWFQSEPARDMHVAEQEWQRKAEINSYAYFVVLFAQVEAHINWLYNQTKPDDSTAALEHRLNVLFNQGSYETTRLLDLYSLRCDIAHGDLRAGFWPRTLASPDPIPLAGDLDFLGTIMQRSEGVSENFGFLEGDV